MRGVLEEGGGEVGGRMLRCSFGVDERGCVLGGIVGSGGRGRWEIRSGEGISTERGWGG